MHACLKEMRRNFLFGFNGLMDDIVTSLSCHAEVHGALCPSHLQGRQNHQSHWAARWTRHNLGNVPFGIILYQHSPESILTG
jgi:hypothetical protein